MDSLPRVRSHERAMYQRCVKQWYWAWRRGLVSRETSYGALEFGTWMHAALAKWYGTGTQRNGPLNERFTDQVDSTLRTLTSNHAPEHLVTRVEELRQLGNEVAQGYERIYQADQAWYVLDIEIPLAFEISYNDGRVAALHNLKLDLVIRDDQGTVWVVEHKTATIIRTEHLAIDNQARAYGAMAEPALRRSGVVNADQPFGGIIYNYLRKALPDQRPTDSHGHYLNQDGSVSKRQPPPYYVRHPVRLQRRAKVVTLQRIQQMTIEITALTLALRAERIRASELPKTPHWSCPKFCPFFRMCVSEENGASLTAIRDMERTMFRIRDPYQYDDEFHSTDEVPTFEMGS